MKLNFRLNVRDLYKYSIFFRNYIDNVAKDCLKNGITLDSVSSTSLDVDDALGNLKIELKAALLQCIISCRFNGVGYILVKTADQFFDLDVEVNNELPIGFMYLDYSKVHDIGPESSHITYYLRNNDINSANIEIKSLEIHKSRLLIYDNYDYILGSYTPCYTESFLLDVYLLEKIYIEIERRIDNHNFLFYKDESLVELQNALSNTAMLLRKESNSGFKGFFGGSSSKNNFVALRDANDMLSREIERLKANLNNEGIFYSGDTDASLEVIKYDMTYLKEALELVKAKIGADSKEPLTRSFNEQTKGLGSDGKGDRSNYYDFLKSVQESIEVSINSKLVKYFGIKMHFGSLVMLSEPEKIERDIKLLEVYERYASMMANQDLSIDDKNELRNRLFLSVGG
ncbi:anti-CBASS protein Acb1 family protein [Borrelia hispanica]|uniref:anti-CBASS protein Acb1 family protein n=2 Tax=Borrelia hispanica TaxID=40835 RepID=UPI00056EB68F|nr:anti-CBASS Acb1 family protein [Borrelia hispanica]